MASFPTYAKLLMGEFSEQRESALLRTEMEEGPPKQARIRSRVMLTRSVSILLGSRSEYLLFMEWFSSDIHEGASWFDFYDPVRREMAQARFVGDGMKATPSAGLSRWTISAQIETWG